MQKQRDMGEYLSSRTVATTSKSASYLHTAPRSPLNFSLLPLRCCSFTGVPVGKIFVVNSGPGVKMIWGSSLRGGVGAAGGVGRATEACKSQVTCKTDLLEATPRVKDLVEHRPQQHVACGRREMPVKTHLK